MSKRELQVGDTVAAYDADGRVTGKITAFGTHGVLGIEDRSGTKLCFHEKQCRRLVPKKPCPPQGGEGKRLERWIARGFGWEILCHTEKTAIEKAQCSNDPVVHLVELKPGEVILDRAKLAKAWRDCGFESGVVTMRSTVANLARALGLEAK